MTSVCIVGAGVAGIITAHALRVDGFDVQLLTRDSSPGGTWAKDRIYPDLSLNSVIGELQFSPLAMAPPPDSEKTGGRLNGVAICSYFQTFADKFLSGRIRFNVEVKNIRRNEDGKWIIRIIDINSGAYEELVFDKVVLCTGGCSNPSTPPSISPAAARAAGFSGLVFHSQEWADQRETVLERVKPKGDGGGTIVVVGGGKSAEDITTYLIKQGRAVKMVFQSTDAFIASPTKLPDFIRKSRFMSVLSPHIELKTRLERFLHTTTIGSKIVHGIWNTMTSTSSVFWSCKTTDEGIGKVNGFFKFVRDGKVDVVAPARVAGFSPDGKGVVLNDGSELVAEAVVACTGYKSSWETLFDDETREEIGLTYPVAVDDVQCADKWDYSTLRNPPKVYEETVTSASAIYRGHVPAKNLFRRDFAVNGSVFTTNNGYTFEVGAHWISSYFLGDAFLQLPPSVEAALAHARKTAAWLRLRYPGQMACWNESYTSNVAFWDYPQLNDDLLEDMGLRTCRSAPHWWDWLIWPFKVVNLKEIENLHEERREKRQLIRSQGF